MEPRAGGVPHVRGGGARLTIDRPYRVRPAAVADVAGLLALLERVAAEGRWIATERVDPERHRARMLAALDDPHEAQFVAEAGGDLVGQLGMTVRAYGVADLGMHVAPEWRRRGVGSALLGAGLDWAAGAGAHKAALQVWPHNEAAIALYRTFGFVEEGVLRRHYRRRSGELWDAVVMGLHLPERPPA
ncbi:MAG TPA: N-acetyltransferase [Acidimicrobiales bacterium]|nr:N-acetyltransferase [Acidimicrobiales bacterium]